MQPYFDPTRKTTYKKNRRQPQKKGEKGRRPQKKGKWKMTSIFFEKLESQLKTTSITILKNQPLLAVT